MEDVAEISVDLGHAVVLNYPLVQLIMQRSKLAHSFHVVDLVLSKVLVT